MAKIVATVARYLLGLALLFFGLNGLFRFMSPPDPTPAAAPLWNGIVASGYMMPVLAILFLAVAVMLLLNKWVPFALVLLAPITVNIILFHVFLDLATIWMGLVVLVLNVYLGVVNWDAYKSMFA